MATTASLRDHLIAELGDLLNAEEQLIQMLPTMAEKSTSPELKRAFTAHLAETRGHATRCGQALELLGENPSGETCEAMKGLLEEGEELMESAEKGALLDAMLITAAQKVEHYEIASYGTVSTYAQVLGERGISRLLRQTLKEEKAADKKLSGIAERSVNAKAAKEVHEQKKKAGVLEQAAEWVGTTAGTVAKKAGTMVKTIAPRSMAANHSGSNRSSDQKSSGTLSGRKSSRGSSSKRAAGGARPKRSSSR